MAKRIGETVVVPGDVDDCRLLTLQAELQRSSFGVGLVSRWNQHRARLSVFTVYGRPASKYRKAETAFTSAHVSFSKWIQRCCTSESDAEYVSRMSVLPYGSCIT